MTQKLFDQDLSKYTTIGIGGRIKTIFLPKNVDQIIESLQECRDSNTPYFVLAGGSNTVFEDTKLNYNQAIIHLRDFDQLQINEIPNPCSSQKSDQNKNQNKQTKVNSNSFEISDSSTKLQKYFEINAQAGVELQKIVDLAKEYNLEGMTGLNRVPGSIGGAVVGNAGAFGCETKDFVESVEVLDLITLETKVLNNIECQFGYRDSIFKHSKKYLILSAKIVLDMSNSPIEEIQKYDEISTKRDTIYPKGLLSPGSLFKNILYNQLDDNQKSNVPDEWVVYGNKLPVGKLLESLSCKGFGIGGIKMRPTHANIMINIGNGNYEEAVRTVQELQSKVKTKYGIDIIPEVRFVEGDFLEFWKAD